MNKFLTAALIATLSISFAGCKLECDDWMEEQDGECVEMRAEHFGSYVGMATAGGQTANAQIDVSTNTSAVNNLNFLLTSGNAYMTLTDESGAFSIPLQNLYYQGITASIEGSGSFSGNQLTMNYVLTFQGANTIVSFTGTK